MANISFHGDPATTIGELPSIGSLAPSFSLTAGDLSDLTNDTLAGKRIVLNIFPSIDTRVCAASDREVKTRAASLDNTAVVCVSADLPFASSRFCAAEGIENVLVGSSFRSSFGRDYGVTLVDTPLAGLLARAVIVLDVDGTVLYEELVSEIGNEPDYDAAVAAL